MYRQLANELEVNLVYCNLTKCDGQCGKFHQNKPAALGKKKKRSKRNHLKVENIVSPNPSTTTPSINGSFLSVNGGLSLPSPTSPTSTVVTLDDIIASARRKSSQVGIISNFYVFKIFIKIKKFILGIRRDSHPLAHLPPRR